LKRAIVIPDPDNCPCLPSADDQGQTESSRKAADSLLLRQVDLLWRRRIIDYLLLRAVRP
jgi:hypothetical protein